jgi:ribonuclease D
LAKVAEEHNIPAENLLTPDYLRRVCWEPPADTSPETLASFLHDKGARQWQINLVAEALSQAFVDARQKTPDTSAPLS